MLVSIPSPMVTLQRPSASGWTIQCGWTTTDWWTSSNPPSDWLTVSTGKVQMPLGREMSNRTSIPSHSSPGPSGRLRQIELRPQLPQPSTIGAVEEAIVGAGRQSGEIELDAEMEAIRSGQALPADNQSSKAAAAGLERDGLGDADRQIAGVVPARPVATACGSDCGASGPRIAGTENHPARSASPRAKRRRAKPADRKSDRPGSCADKRRIAVESPNRTA